MPLTKVTSGAITDSAVTTAKIEDGTIVNADISASANIAQSKLSLSLPTISSISIQDSQGAIPPSDTSLYFDVVGTNFTNPSTVELLNSSTNASTNATTVTYVSATQLRVTASLSAGTYKIRVTRSDGFAGISATALLTVSQAVSWSTSAGSLGTFDESVAISTITLSATSNSSVTYAVQSGSLPTGLSLSSAGAITGTPGSISADTTSTFTVRATDAESQYADREFTITVSDIVIQQSLVSNADDGNYLYKTLSTPTNAKKFTLSLWTKRSDLSAVRYLLVAGTSSPFTTVGFAADDTFGIGLNAGVGSVGLYTTQVFRDPSAWYHIFIVMDTTQATDSNRLKMYINGSQITSFSNESYPTQDSTWTINSAVQHDVVGSSAVQDYGGYTAEYHFLDGYTAAVTDFGTTDSTTGNWKPKTYSGGNYGTNGFYLDFNNTSDFGEDQSGNSNNFTNSGYAATDQTTDTPHNIFATLNELHNMDASLGATTYSEGNTIAKFTSASQNGNALGTIGVGSGKWYWEVKCLALGGQIAIGIADVDVDYYSASMNQSNDFTCFYRASDGYKQLSGTASSYGATIGSNDIVGVALNLDDNQITFYKNGSSQGAISITGGYRYLPANYGYNNGEINVNFGNPSFSISSGNADENGYGNFEYAPPSGFLALCTNNLPELTIKDSSAYFNTVLYTGTGSTGRSVTGVGFQPDIVWIKNRTDAWGHSFNDSSRGTNKTLITNSTATEQASYAYGYLSSFDSDGFTLADGASGDDFVNQTSDNYVTWCWNVNDGTKSTNNDGTIESYVQVNTTAGISIVQYQGNGTNGATFGHGLGSIPDVSIYKCREQATEWAYWPRRYNPGASNTVRLSKNDAFGGTNGAGFFNDTAPTSSVITLGTRSEVNQSSQNYVSYHFKSIPGFSQFGKYKGLGGTSGTFVNTGFKPAFVMIKCVTAGTTSWRIGDTTRSTYNPQTHRVQADLSNAESTSSTETIDIVSNGFKARNDIGGINTAGEQYIYMAFAESPFGGILTTETTAR